MEEEEEKRLASSGYLSSGEWEAALTQIYFSLGCSAAAAAALSRKGIQTTLSLN